MKVNLETPLSELTEDQIIAALWRNYPDGGSLLLGDDCALMEPNGDGAQTLVTSDMLIEDRDFVMTASTLYDIGWKSTAVNLSDIGAMGGVPSGLQIALGIPRTYLLADILRFSQGVADACQKLAPTAGVTGGDLSDADKIVISVTASGTVPAGFAVTRAGAQTGDGIYYAGQLGYAAAGIRAMLQGFDAPVTAQAVSAQLRPQPPVWLGPVARAHGAHSLIDVTDGLALDGARIARKSEVTLDFDSSVIAPLAAELGWVRHDLGADPWQLVMAGGEDFGLLATFPPEADIPTEFRLVGEVVERQEHAVLLSGKPMAYHGFDHFLKG